jgi:hypothetical protein
LNAAAGESGIWRFLPTDDINYSLSITTPFNGGTASITTGASQSLLSLSAGAATNTLNISSSGDIGIGTTSPQGRLHVAGGITGSSTLGIQGTTTLWGNLSLYGGNNNTTYALEYNYTGSLLGKSNVLHFRQGGSTPGAIMFTYFGLNSLLTLISNDFNNAKVGVNTPNPSATLHVSGSSGSALLKVDSDVSSSILFISGSGNTGINTSTPGAKLDIKGTGTTTELVLKTQDSAGVVGMTVLNKGWIGNKFNTPTALIQSDTFIDQQYADDGSKPTWLLSYNGAQVCNMFMGNGYEMNIANPSVGSNNGLYFLTGGLTTSFRRLTILRDGNIGVGNFSPTARFQVRGSGTTSSTTSFRVENANTSASMVVLDDGNIGIGTTNPQFKLDLSGSLRMPNAAGLYMNTTTGDAIQTFYFDSGNNLNFTATASGDTYFREGSNTLIRLINGGSIYLGGTTATTSPVMKIMSAGSVGIGMKGVNPTAVLQLSGSGTSTILQLDSAAASNILFVSGSGFVGIGTSSPAYKFQVNGSVYFSGGPDFYVDGTSRFGGNSQYSTVINNSGSVGIGTKIPSSSLHISGSSGSALLRADSDISSSILFVSGSGRVGVGTFNPIATLDIINHSNTVSSIPVATFRTSGSTGHISLHNWTSPMEIVRVESSNDIASGGSLRLYTLNSGTMTEKFRITNDGQTYIGTGGVTPTARLQVRGIGATSATTTFLLQNSTPTTLMTVLDNGQFTYSGPLLTLGASQSAYTITQSISSSNIVGAQVYGVNITPTFWQTTASQTETAFRVAATFTQSSAVATSGSNIIADFGATSVGSQLTITDVTSGSIYMVNDVSGLPIIEATSDWTVNMYNFPNIVFQKTGSTVNITGSLRVTGSLVMSPTSSFVFPLSQSASPLTGSAYWSGSLLFIWDGSRYRSSSFA